MGRGKVVASVLAVVFHLGLTHRLVDGWGRGAGASRRASGQPKCGNGLNAESGCAILGRGAKRDFPWRAVLALGVPRTSRAAR